MVRQNNWILLTHDGDFGLISDTDVTNELGIAFITPLGIEFYDQDGYNIIDIAPLQEFKDMTLAWRNYLLNNQ